MLEAALDPNALNDVAALRELVLAQRESMMRPSPPRDDAIRHRDIQIAALTHELARYKRWLLAAKREKLDPAQRALFEDDVAADLTAIAAEHDALAASSSPSRKTPPKREALPAHLPRETVTLEPESCQCAACGRDLVRIGEEVSEKLDYRPIAVFVRRTVRGKYACQAC